MTTATDPTERPIVRIVTATALFDGHDAAINIYRRMLQSSGAEVIHLGHNRSVQEIVKAVVEEDAHGVAVSSYQGGHMEFFKYLVDALAEAGAAHVQVFGGGGGVILPEEIDQLQRHGVSRIYSPEDGTRMGLQGIIDDIIERMIAARRSVEAPPREGLDPVSPGRIAAAITWIEQASTDDRRAWQEGLTIADDIPVVGITGTGGSGKSSLTDELVLRFRQDDPAIPIAIICADPSRRRTGGALLGDRIRMNAIDGSQVYMRSLATRRSQIEIPESVSAIVAMLKAAGYRLVIVETAGIGQGDSRIVDMVDVALYVMTGEFGAASQLEKIDMLDFADLVAVNKYEKRGSEDAVRAVRSQVQRNRTAFDQDPSAMPVYGTIAARFNDDGVTALYHALRSTIAEKTGVAFDSTLAAATDSVSSSTTVVIPPARTRYLSEIADTVRHYHNLTDTESERLRRAWQLEAARDQIAAGPDTAALAAMDSAVSAARDAIAPDSRDVMERWATTRQQYESEELVYSVRGREIRTPLRTTSLAGQIIPKIALPRFTDPGDVYQWLRRENLPGHFPFTAGVFPLKRVDEAPTRMFAGEGDPARTNRRFKLLSSNQTAKRLSTAFDSVTLYGFDPEERPDIYGKVGNSGVSVCTLDDVKVLYGSFDLCAPGTSVSMTINGPAPIILAMFMNTAIDQRIEAFGADHGRAPNDDETRTVRADALAAVRGTVQADILKEDQGQNTCIFSIDFALKMMGDIQAFFNDHDVRNFYSVSISGYHIAEAGANPITQLAFTLANGFTYLEYYLARGMDIDTFGPNLSFFFSNGLDPEYTVIGRVARRIWAIALRDKYGASARAQQLKYHIQTSGRSLHSQDIQFNDIRTTLQALCAVYDNCNSLHTNAFDEAITTPTEESVRRALAIQMIINREWGVSKNENPLQGAFIVDELTDLVEEAVLMEFDRIASRGGVLGAMENGYQRSKIQEESIHYEVLKHTGELPIVGVNTFRDPNAADNPFAGGMMELDLARATTEEKESQLARLRAFHDTHAAEAADALDRLKQTALDDGNIFGELMHTVRHCSLGQITRALFEVGGKYRRNM